MIRISWLSENVFRVVWAVYFPVCFILQCVFSTFSSARRLQPQMGQEADAADEPEDAPVARMLDSHHVPRARASNHRGTAGRCSREFACLILNVFIGPWIPTNVAVGGR